MSPTAQPRSKVMIGLLIFQSHILIVQSALHDKNTLGWKLFHLTAYTARQWPYLAKLTFSYVYLVSLQVLTRVGLRAKMNFTFFGTHKEVVVVELVEVEAHTSCKSIQESFFLVLYQFFVLVDDQLQLDDFFGLELVLHQSPASNSTI